MTPASLSVALTTLGANPLRTLLSTLGVVMGMASLVAVLSIGDGLEAFARSQIARTTDVQTILVEPTEVDMVDGVSVPRTDYARFGLQDLHALRGRLGPRAAVGIGTTGGGRVALGDSLRGVVVAAVTPELFERALDSLVAGAPFTHGEVSDSARVAIVSWTLAAALDAANPAAAVGQRVAAASLMAIAPIVVFGWFSQKQLVQGLTFGAVK